MESAGQSKRRRPTSPERMHVDQPAVSYVPSAQASVVTPPSSYKVLREMESHDIETNVTPSAAGQKSSPGIPPEPPDDEAIMNEVNTDPSKCHPAEGDTGEAKMEDCQQHLQNWNQQHFGNIFQKKKRLLARLEGQSGDMERNGLAQYICCYNLEYMASTLSIAFLRYYAPGASQLSWKPPPAGCFKYNVDAGLLDSGQASIAGVQRNSQGASSKCSCGIGFAASGDYNQC